MNCKRGQITAFIIIGLVILFSIATITLIRDEARVFPGMAVHPELMPLAEYTMQCIEEVGSVAIRLIGINGGYMTIPEEIGINPLAYLNLGGSKLPLWYFEGESRVTSKEHMELEITGYVLSKIDQCLNDYEDFRKQYDIEITGAPTAETIINDDAVLITLDYPLKVETKIEFKDMELPPIRAEIPLRLGKLFKLATAIMDYENTNFFLEEKVNDIIASSGFPYEGFDVRCGETGFYKSEMREELLQMIPSNFHYMTFANTDYFDPQDEPALTSNNFEVDGQIYSFADYYTNNYHFQVSEDDFSDVQVFPEVRSDQWFYFDVGPRTGDIVKPIDLNIPFIGMCLKIYHHRYDVKFPMIFRLVDTKQNQDFQFLFATPVLIEDNQPSRHFPQTNPFFMVEPGELAITDEDFCANIYDLEFQVFAKDYRPNLPYDGFLSNVSVSYECVNFVCDIGEIEKKPNQAWPVLRSEFPKCTRGLLRLEKEGYLPAYEHISIGQGMEEDNFLYDQAIVEMIPVNELDYSFKVVEYIGNVPFERDLLANESVMVKLVNHDYSHLIDLFYPQGGDLYSTMSLIPRDLNYSLEMYLIYDETLRGGYNLEFWNPDPLKVESSNHLELKLITKKPYPTSTNGFLDLWENYVLSKAEQHKPELELR